MKNWVLILLILIIPLVSYWKLNESQSVTGKNQSSQAIAAVNKPQVIKFAAQMCLDCTKQKKIFEKIVPEFQKNIDFIYIDAQSKDKKTQNLIQKYNISVVPTTIFLNGKGEVVKKVKGLITEDKLELYLKELN